jgi:glutathione synthase/RimK-type ligase-like ATP-grasp enzyme
MTQRTLPKILLLSSAEIEETTVINDDFVRVLNESLAGKCQLEWRNYQEIGIRLDTNTLEAYVVETGEPLSAYRAVYFKSYFRYHEQATAIAEALEAQNIHFVGTELRQYIPAYKLSQLARLSRSGLHIPKTLYLPMPHYLKQYNAVVEQLGAEFIFKAIDGSTGDDNYLIQNEAQLKKVVAAHADRHFIAQSFVPNESDLRVLVVGGVIRLVIERRRKDNSTHLNNTSQGAQAKLIALADVSPEIKETALRAANIMNREIAGVDIMEHADTKVPYVLEVNASPQIASGAFLEEKLEVFRDYFEGLAV